MKKIVLLLATIAVAGAQTPEARPYTGNGPFSPFVRKYLPRYQPPVEMGNSGRLESLMRAGNIYLSLADAIALALENNLDIEYHRYSDRRQAETDVLRASAGQLLRFTPSGISSGFSSASSGALGAANALGNLSSASASSVGQSSILSGFTIQSAGSNVPNLDPVLFIGAQGAHQTNPLTSSFTTGTNALISSARSLNWGIQKSFLTGTTVQAGMGYQTLYQNSPINDINPSLTGSTAINITQPLLQGFGWATNSRYIRIARNNLEVSDLNFKGQVIATVKNVIDLYWDLVSFQDNLKVKQHALELAQKLYEDNKRRASLGAIAPIDIIQAEATVATAQLDYSTAEAQVLQQEMILKAALTRTGIDSLAVVDARIVPTDPIRVPDQEQIEPLQDMITEALYHRPEVKATQIQLENSRLTMLGVKNALRPSLSVYANLSNSGLSGQINAVPVPAVGGPSFVPSHANLSNFFIGSYGTLFSQILSRNFPNYSIGFNFNMFLRNSSTQADMIKAQLDMRQAQIQEKQQENSIKLAVVNARIALQQARASYETAVKARMLQEQTFNGTRRKYELGTSSFLDVVLIQRDVVTAQSSEVGALRSYIAARTSLELVLGQTLAVNHVDIEEAYKGQVKRPPSPLPAVGAVKTAPGAAKFLLK